ncbi:MAG TPA: type II secretion system F family protein [Acidimicrobiales bacterium]|nr:type II secretion system F family protein [Acidimicrobiales bacterium]
MIRLVLGAGALVWTGATLLLSCWARLDRPSLLDRLRPYHPGAPSVTGGRGSVSVASLRDVLGPLARTAGDRMAGVFGVTESVSVRLRRIHSGVDATAFRVRQMLVAGASMVAGAVMAAALAGKAPAAIAALLVLGLPVLAFLVIEQRLARASDRWKRDVALELPVVSEQIAMLLNAGYSLGAALSRVAARGRGCVAQDLSVVVNRVRQGISDTDALREWAEVAQVDGVTRLVGVLALHSEAADLGRLVSAEAGQARRDLHRRTLEAIERRAQQVWVPVTVATLVPGVILLAIPFLSALRLFSNA